MQLHSIDSFCVLYKYSKTKVITQIICWLWCNFLFSKICYSFLMYLCNAAYKLGNVLEKKSHYICPPSCCRIEITVICCHCVVCSLFHYNVVYLIVIIHNCTPNIKTMTMVCINRLVNTTTYPFQRKVQSFLFHIFRIHIMTVSL